MATALTNVEPDVAEVLSLYREDDEHDGDGTEQSEESVCPRCSSCGCASWVGPTWASRRW